MATEIQVTDDRYPELLRELPLRQLRFEADLDRAITMLDRLLDRGQSRRSEDEEDYPHVLGTLISEYEDVHWPMPADLEAREPLPPFEKSEENAAIISDASTIPSPNDSTP